jgi:hypothetical protein
VSTNVIDFIGEDERGIGIYVFFCSRLSFTNLELWNDVIVVERAWSNWGSEHAEESRSLVSSPREEASNPGSIKDLNPEY